MSADECRGSAMTALQAEALAAQFGLQYAWDAWFRKVELESDCQYLIEMLRHKKKENLRAQIIVDDTLNLAAGFEACNFLFANRKCNKAAHAMTSASLGFEETLVWMEECQLM